MSKVYTVEEIKKDVSEVAERYGVQAVYLFGSYARETADEQSDLDLLIEKGEIKGLFQLAGFHQELEDTLEMKVDILTPEALSDSFKNRIKADEVLLYERQNSR